MKSIGHPKQPTPVLELAADLFADLHREGAAKHDDRRVTA